MRIGIDLGGTSIKGGIVDEKGSILLQKSLKTIKGKDENGDKICNGIIQIIRELIKAKNVSIDEVELIGLGIPGNIDYQRGIVGRCVNLGWENVHLGSILEKEFGKRVLIDNDANVAAGAEYLFGSSKDNKISLLVTLGTGVGSGAVLNGKIYRGINGAAMELGHTIVGENFYNCSCGNNGCLETFTSATAIIKYAIKLIEEGRKTIITDSVNGELHNIDAKIVFDAARKGDGVALEVLNRFIKYLAIGINNAINILDLDSVVIGGGVSAGCDLFIDKLVSEINKIKLYKDTSLCTIRKATLGNSAGIIGAAMLDKI
ncbi:ROK family protein [Clostridium sp. KNHs214]|uniref:ROK family protein n=1 Tax=Clostridium sp. KNHs214 TaxID=1540257 RepID=UPI0005531EA3|nr:ROK family protein [Clostridium sp. KNHs214]